MVPTKSAQPAAAAHRRNDRIFACRFVTNAQRAQEASARGRHADAQIYHGISETSMQTQIASERVAAGVALGAAIQQAGAVLLDLSIISNAQAVANYLQEESWSVISDRAPAGTVLELFFRAHKADGADAEPADIIMTWEAMATFKDADGKLWRSSASYKTYLMVAFGSEPKPTPEEFKQSRYLLMDWPMPLPAGSGDAYAKEFQEIVAVSKRGGAVELAVVAATAIDGLYASRLRTPRGGKER